MAEENLIRVLLNEEFELRFKEKREAGEGWNIEYNPWALKVVKEDYSIPKLRFKNTKGLRTLVFHAYKTGEYEIKCKYVNPDGDVLETKLYNIKCHNQVGKD